jgi:1-deoxy-D-xylulose-5-phosphate reductoisomerase
MMEAHYLFGIPPERIKIVIHPESIIHSMVEFCDGSIMAQLSTPDMRLPIQYALTYPQRLPSLVKDCRVDELGKLTFHKPDKATFKCLDLAYLALKRGGIIPAVMNAANEVAVQAFLEGRISFLQIPELISGVMKRHQAAAVRSVSDVVSADRSARRLAEELLNHTKANKD